MTTKKLHNSAGRAAVTVAPKQYGHNLSVVFATPIRVCNSMKPNAPADYKWPHRQPNPRTGT